MKGPDIGLQDLSIWGAFALVLNLFFNPRRLGEVTSSRIRWEATKEIKQFQKTQQTGGISSLAGVGIYDHETQFEFSPGL